MSNKIFSSAALEILSSEAKKTHRKRINKNIHKSCKEKCQYLLNAISIGSYIAPHRHIESNKSEILVAVKGLFCGIIFNDHGGIVEYIFFGTEKFKNIDVGLEISCDQWHSIVALENDSVLLEIKEGPYNQDTAKEYAPWAPKEGSHESKEFFLMHYKNCLSIYNKNY